MTASTGRPPTSVRSRVRQAAALRIRSKRSRSINGIVTRSDSIPLARSSCVRRRTCRSAPPSEKGVWTARTRTRGEFMAGKRKTENGKRGSSRFVSRFPIPDSRRARHARDERIVLLGEEQPVQLRVILRALLEALRRGQRGVVLDSRLRKPGCLGKEGERL